MRDPEERRRKVTDAMRLMAAGDYITVPDPSDPKRVAIFAVDGNGRRAEEPAATGLKNRTEADRWIRARHNLPPDTNPQEDLWTPK